MLFASSESGLGDGMPQPFDMLSIIYLRVEVHTNSETLGAREMINDLCLAKKFFWFLLLDVRLCTGKSIRLQ
jgi:hypothetical protein